MIDIDQAKKGLRDFRETYARYTIDGTALPINTHALLYAAEVCSGVEIRVISVAVAGAQIKAQLRRYPRYAQIIYSDKLNDCWARFAITKEVAHLLCDDDSCFVKSVDQSHDLIGNLIHRPKFAPGATPDDYMSENLAIYMALEILFPVSDRAFYIEQLKNKKTGIYDIAVTYKIPQRYVEMVLDPGVHEVLNDIFKD